MPRFVLGLALVLLAACGRPEARYPPQYETNFMSGCHSGGSSRARCACIWDRIEAEIDPNSFAALEQLPGPERAAHPLMQQIQGYAQACSSAPPVEPPPAP
jgi:hypothetical protein